MFSLTSNSYYLSFKLYRDANKYLVALILEFIEMMFLRFGAHMYIAVAFMLDSKVVLGERYGLFLVSQNYYLNSTQLPDPLLRRQSICQDPEQEPE